MPDIDTMLRWMGCFAVLLGTAIATSGAARYREERRKARRRVRTVGTVIRYRETMTSPVRFDDFGEGPPLYVPVVRFATADGEEVEVEDDLSRPRHSLPRIGAQVTVYFDPRDPRDASVGHPARRGGLVMLLVGVFLCFAGAVFVVVAAG